MLRVSIVLGFWLQVLILSIVTATASALWIQVGQRFPEYWSVLGEIHQQRQQSITLMENFAVCKQRQIYHQKLLDGMADGSIPLGDGLSAFLWLRQTSVYSQTRLPPNDLSLHEKESIFQSFIDYHFLLHQRDKDDELLCSLFEKWFLIENEIGQIDPNPILLFHLET